MRALTRQSAASQGGGGLRGMINGTKVAEDKSSSLTLAHAHSDALPLVSTTRLVGLERRSTGGRFGIGRAMTSPRTCSPVIWLSSGRADAGAGH